MAFQQMFALGSLDRIVSAFGCRSVGLLAGLLALSGS